MRRLILLTLCVLTSAITFGQTSFGVKAGLNVSNTKGFDSEAKPIVAQHMGAYANITVGKRLFFRPELLHTVKGYKFPKWNTYEEGRFVAHYLALPVLFGMRPTEDISILVGAEVGYLLNAKFHFADSTSSNLRHFNKVDFALAMGAAYRFASKLAVEFRYNHGFEDLLTVSYSDQSGNYTRKVGAHRAFQLSLSYRLSKSL